MLCCQMGTGAGMAMVEKLEEEGRGMGQFVDRGNYRQHFGRILNLMSTK